MANLSYRGAEEGGKELYSFANKSLFKEKNGIIKTDKVFEVMLATDRCHYAKYNPYMDSPQSIGFQATISAPHMHAYALELLSDQLHEGAKALDVGSGSGILTACFSRMVGPKGQVVGIDHIKELVDDSINNVKKDDPTLLSSGRVKLIVGDGRMGYAEEAPYDAIHVGAAAPVVPQAVSLDVLGVREGVPSKMLSDDNLKTYRPVKTWRKIDITSWPCWGKPDARTYLPCLLGAGMEERPYSQTGNGQHQQMVSWTHCDTKVQTTRLCLTWHNQVVGTASSTTAVLLSSSTARDRSYSHSCSPLLGSAKSYMCHCLPTRADCEQKQKFLYNIEGNGSVLKEDYPRWALRQSKQTPQVHTYDEILALKFLCTKNLDLSE
ncbi:hypothetical protein IHE44_0009365 [Lamprotornis superbus]|uniref:Protein-L-isoaspartate(D-aspartate) O-methyltransferase n=9 Tax=Neoaves TaxID=3078114 RepID=A0A835U1N7_9PASS|nr:hypothetical protein IHE44_0009365 [Lamprotornis superbus]